MDSEPRYKNTIASGLMMLALVLVALAGGLVWNVTTLLRQEGSRSDSASRFAEFAMRLDSTRVVDFVSHYDLSSPSRDTDNKRIRALKDDMWRWFDLVHRWNDSSSSYNELKLKWQSASTSLDTILTATTPQQVKAAQETLDAAVKGMQTLLIVGDGTEDLDDSGIQYSCYWQVALASGMAFVALAMFTMGRGIGGRTRSLTETVERMARGELDLEAEVTGTDELASIASAFNEMTRRVRETLHTRERLIHSIQQMTVRLSSATGGVVTSTSQQVRGAQEQAAAIAETVAAVEEVEQTTRQSAARAAAVAESSQLALDNGKAGRQAVDDSISAMERVRQQVESIAENILTLAEQAQNIGEIVSSVDHIADQTNLLALNAAIEAARAGEQGRGFTVVANEIRLLADQSKRATVQVRQMLSAIQKLTQRSVLSMEDGTRSVSEATSVVSRADDTIRELVDTVNLAATAASQILTSANQQSVGMRQIHQAMKNIQEITTSSLSATQKAQGAVHELNGLAESMKGLLQTNGHAPVEARAEVAPLDPPLAVALS